MFLYIRGNVCEILTSFLITDSILSLISFFKLVGNGPLSSFNAFTGPTFLPTPHTQPSPTALVNNFSSELMQRKSIIPEEDIDEVFQVIKQSSSNFKQLLSEKMLYTLLLSILEGVCIKTGSRGTTQISSTIHLFQEITTLFEELISLWLQAYNDDKSKKTDAYKGTVQIARIALQFWLVLSTQVQQSSLSAQQISEVKPLLSFPFTSVSKACFNLQQAGLFKDNKILDQEFTLIILESFFSSLFAVNTCAVVPLCSVDDFYEVLRDTLTDGSHEWFAYICSKLHGISSLLSSTPTQEDPLPSDENKSNWPSILQYSFETLTYTLKELIAISSHIQSCQKASKLALTSTYESVNNRFVPFLKPVVYSLEVATGFDKLTLRLSKIAQLLLSSFRSVPLLQLLSLQLLSETAKDTVSTISDFLSSISDLSVRSNAEVLDLYLELLENVWFRLPSDYQLPASSPWWNKLSNYFNLLLESPQEIVCQVIYHLQCMFGHKSSVLKSRLTQFVIIPFHRHLTSLVKETCFKSCDTDGTTTLKESFNPNATLDNKNTVIITLFMKLLAKVMSSSHSLGKFASDSYNLYSLFLYLPLSEFRAPALNVLEECLRTLKSLSSQRASDLSSPTTTERAETPETEDTGILNTIMQILLQLACSVHLDEIPEQCLLIANGKGSLKVFGLKEVDKLQKIMQNVFERKPIKELLVPSFVRHLAVIADIWNILYNLAITDSRSTKILHANHVWDVIHDCLAPSLASLLSRLQQRLSREQEAVGLDLKLLDLLRESVVTLMSHLLTLAHYLCWKRKDLKVSVYGCVESKLVLIHRYIYIYI